MARELLGEVAAAGVVPALAADTRGGAAAALPPGMAAGVVAEGVMPAKSDACEGASAGRAVLTVLILLLLLPPPLRVRPVRGCWPVCTSGAVWWREDTPRDKAGT